MRPESQRLRTLLFLCLPLFFFAHRKDKAADRLHGVNLYARQHFKSVQFAAPSVLQKLRNQYAPSVPRAANRQPHSRRRLSLAVSGVDMQFIVHLLHLPAALS